MFAFIVTAALTVSPTAQYAEAKAACIKGDYDLSDRLLAGIKPGGPIDRGEYHYYRLVNHYRLNLPAPAEADLKALDDTFDLKLPRRHQALVGMIRADLEQWKQGDLYDIGRDMKHSADRLDHGKSGPATQKVQKDIVDKLTRLIEEEEDKKNQQANGGGKDGKGKPKPKPGQSPDGSPTDPAQDSTVMGKAGAGKVDDKKLREVSEQWGSLPPAKRAAVVAEITRDVPAKYKPMVDEYFKALNRRHGLSPMK